MLSTSRELLFIERDPLDRPAEARRERCELVSPSERGDSDSGSPRRDRVDVCGDPVRSDQHRVERVLRYDLG